MERVSKLFFRSIEFVERKFLRITLLIIAASSFGLAQTLDDFLHERIKQLTMARLGQTSIAAQKGAPSTSSNSTALLDKTSVSDLINFGLNLAQFTRAERDSTNTTSATITTSLYALYAAAQGIDPLEPLAYNQYGYLRNFSFTYGFDDPKETTGQSSAVYSAKLLLWNGRDPASERNAKHLDAITKGLTASGSAFGRVSRRVQDYLFERSGESDKGDFLNRIAQNWQKEQKSLSNEDLDAIDAIILPELVSFESLDATVSSAVEQIRSAPQAALTATVKKEGESTKLASVILNYESGIKKDFYLLANVAYQEERVSDRGTVTSGNIGIEVEWRPSGETFGKTENRLSVSGSTRVSFLDGIKPEYRYQISIGIPALEGLILPLSLRWSKGSLLDVAEFSSHLGIALDMAKIIQ